MATDTTLPLRQAVIRKLRADTALIELGQPPLADRIYGERAPATLVWPFVRYGQTDVGQVDGRLPIHAFSKPQGGFTDEVAEIAAAIVAALDGKRLILSDGRKATLTWPESGGTQIIPDGAEADAWHAIVRFDVAIPRSCSS